MWDFSLYIFGELAFKDLFQGSSEVVRARASRTVLKISCKSSLIYLGIVGVAAEITATESFATEDPGG